METEHIGKQHSRETLNASVQFLRSTVEETAYGSQLILDVSQLALQLHEVLVSLQVGISLHAYLQASQSTAQRILSLNLIVQIRSTHSSCTSLSDTLQQTLLMLGIALNRIYKVRDKVVTLLQLNLDIGKRILAVVAKGNQIIIDTNHPENKN